MRGVDEMFHREDRRKENVPMSRNLRFVAMIVSPVRWDVANCFGVVPFFVYAI